MATTHKPSVVAIRQLTRLRIIASVFFVIMLLFPLHVQLTSADTLTNRRLTIGSPLASDVTTHQFVFNTSTSASIGSVVFNYCSNLPFYDAVCDVPVGLAVNSATLSSTSGLPGVTISAPDTTANRIVLTRTPSLVTPTPVSAFFSNITNHSTPNSSVYVRISIHASTDGSGTPIDFGAVVYSTTQGVGVGGFVPPYLTFCAGVTVELNCSSTQGNLLSFGELSTSQSNVLTSQFAAATNDLSGYNTFISGGTMTAGNSIIPALSSNATNQVGTSQFGINLRANSSPSVGANVSGSGIATPATNYNISNSFRYVDGELIASASGPTEYNRFTVTYLVNISDEQRPGVYSSSFTFTAIANF